MAAAVQRVRGLGCLFPPIPLKSNFHKKEKPSSTSYPITQMHNFHKCIIFDDRIPGIFWNFSEKCQLTTHFLLRNATRKNDNCQIIGTAKFKRISIESSSNTSLWQPNEDYVYHPNECLQVVSFVGIGRIT